ncbi:glycosyltransferase family 39 protein [Ancylobacter lacus]|uniref:glycosyltransferase family 39 protein n=1 Tax=Ancylobacter lacus TaxID=2579970 RepID=UPI0031B880E3
MSATSAVESAAVPSPGTAAPDPLFGASNAAALALIAALLLLRLVLAAGMPLVPDEAYYALWATSLSPGYLDHPPMIAVFIRLGQMLAGDTPFGVRLVTILAVVPASACIWRAAGLLLEDRRAGPLAAVLFNVTIFGFLGMTLATPDAPLAVFSAAMVYCAARLARAPGPGWWLAMGLATGLALEAKYSAAMLAGGFALGVLALPGLRRELLRPWPWLALALALLVFLPNLAWNQMHGWETFTKQGGRVTAHALLRPRFLGELVAVQVALATPLVFLFGVAGLLPRAARQFRPGPGRALLLFMLLVPLAYFAVHALRSRVEGNWLGFLYPLLAIAAAAGLLSLSGTANLHLRRMRRLAVPVALGLVLGLAAYALVRPPAAAPLRDPVVRMTQGWPAFAIKIDARRREAGAGLLLTDNYQLAAMLRRELPGVRVAQYNERARYRFLDEPDPLATAGPALVVAANRSEDELRAALGPLAPLGTVSRRFDEVELATVRLYRVELPPVPAPGG